MRGYKVALPLRTDARRWTPEPAMSMSYKHRAIFAANGMTTGELTARRRDKPLYGQIHQCGDASWWRTDVLETTAPRILLHKAGLAEAELFSCWPGSRPLWDYVPIHGNAPDY